MMSKSVFIIIFSSRHKQFALLQKKRDAIHCVEMYSLFGALSNKIGRSELIKDTTKIRDMRKLMLILQRIVFLARDSIAYMLSALYATVRPSGGQTGVS